MALKQGKSPKRLIPKARAIEAPQAGEKGLETRGFPGSGWCRWVCLLADVPKKHGLVFKQGNTIHCAECSYMQDVRNKRHKKKSAFCQAAEILSAYVFI